MRNELTPVPARSVKSVLAWAGAALALLFAFDAALFRAPWYYHFLEPNSSAGQLEAYLHWLSITPHTAQPEIAVFGDSRVAHGFSASVAEAAVGNRARFWNFGIAGTLPRDWYYMLRDADPARNRFSAIFLALDQYSDEDYIDVYADRIIDLNFLIARLRLADCGSFAASMRTLPNRERALLGCLLKGIALQSDFLDLLSNPKSRAHRAADWRERGLAALNSFTGIDRNLIGLSADWSQRRIVFPHAADAAARATIQATVMPSWPPHTGETTRYRQYWLPKIFELYRGSPTRVVLFELPRAPLPKPESATPSVAVDNILRRHPDAAIDRTTFRDLERPEFFFDGLHLNRNGRRIFSVRFADMSLRLIP